VNASKVGPSTRLAAAVEIIFFFNEENTYFKLSLYNNKFLQVNFLGLEFSFPDYFHAEILCPCLNVLIIKLK